jgi:uncharacterized protein
MWIQTYTGRKFYPLEPDAGEIDIRDIAHALALKCRYGGRCREFFSIAQHSVLVSRLVPLPDAKWGLLHDAGEAYLCDVPTPVKGAFFVRDGLSLSPLGVVEGRILAEVARAFGLCPPPIPLSVNVADVRCLERERRQLMGPPPEEWATAQCWDGDATPIECWGLVQAEVEFLARWRELT